MNPPQNRPREGKTAAATLAASQAFKVLQVLRLKQISILLFHNQNVPQSLSVSMLNDEGCNGVEQHLAVTRWAPGSLSMAQLDGLYTRRVLHTQIFSDSLPSPFVWEFQTSKIQFLLRSSQRPEDQRRARLDGVSGHMLMECVTGIVYADHGDAFGSRGKWHKSPAFLTRSPQHSTSPSLRCVPLSPHPADRSRIFAPQCAGIDPTTLFPLTRTSVYRSRTY